MMVAEEINWMAGGPQGSGVDSAANIFGRACGYGGLFVYGRREYHSNIKGLHSYFHLRVSKHEILANVNDVDLLAAFDAETVVRHITEVVKGGGIIIDAEQANARIFDIPPLPPEFKEEFRRFLVSKGLGDNLSDLLADAEKNSVRIFKIPYMQLLEGIAKQLQISQISKITRMINVLNVGVTFALLDYDPELVERAIKVIFADKPKVIDMNMIAFKAAYDYVGDNFGRDFGHKLEKAETSEKRIFLSGNEAVALGKVLGGCRVQTYYPITPAADESEYLEAHEIFKIQGGKGSIIVVQTEDEIAAVNSVSGAVMAGARAATSTSGPGFALMVEGLSWAGNSEVPIVITYYQRGSPATGLPTRFGQSDLRFAVHAGHGEFPRIVLASGDIQECFYDAAVAFNYAERFQVPVIHLIDKAMANSSQTYKIFDLSPIKVERGDFLDQWKTEDGSFRRFLITQSGISPRVALGSKGAVHWYTGDEHNEVGHISEEPFTRRMMVDKRMTRLDLIDKEVTIEEKLNFYGDKDSKNIIISWGSPKGAILEAMELLGEEGFDLGFVQVRMLHPLPRAYLGDLLKGCERIIDVENNYLGQLGGIVKEETGIQVNYRVLKYTGRPITTTEMYDSLKNILTGRTSSRQVLTYGS